MTDRTLYLQTGWTCSRERIAVTDCEPVSTCRHCGEYALHYLLGWERMSWSIPPDKPLATVCVTRGCRSCGGTWPEGHDVHDSFDGLLPADEAGRRVQHKNLLLRVIAVDGVDDGTDRWRYW